MKNIVLIFLSFCCVGLLSCSDDDDATPIEPTLDLPVQGSYSWAFEIPGAGNQVSTHDFANDVIAYTMVGDVYNVAYNMEVLSYDTTMQKIIALGEEGSPKSGVYFAIFLKDISDTTVTLYKAELGTEQEAVDMAVPSDDNTEFHGWNTYRKD